MDDLSDKATAIEVLSHVDNGSPPTVRNAYLGEMVKQWLSTEMGK